MQETLQDSTLNKLKDIASEHFDEYLLVVTKGGKIWNTYKSKCSAHGMASMILQDIHQDWSAGRSNVNEE